jgi:hypothetical protein
MTMLRSYRRGNRISFFTLDKSSTISLYELLTQRHTTLLAISDGGADKPKNYGSFGWVLGADRELLCGNAKASHKITQCNPSERKGMVASPYFHF